MFVHDRPGDEDTTSPMKFNDRMLFDFGDPTIGIGKIINVRLEQAVTEGKIKVNKSTGEETKICEESTWGHLADKAGNVWVYSLLFEHLNTILKHEEGYLLYMIKSGYLKVRDYREFYMASKLELGDMVIVDGKPMVVISAEEIRHFECVNRSKNENKFWEIIRTGPLSFTTRYGRIGTSGSETPKDYRTAERCQKEYDSLLREKQNKGYKETKDPSFSYVFNAPAHGGKVSCVLRSPDDLKFVEGIRAKTIQVIRKASSKIKD